MQKAVKQNGVIRSIIRGILGGDSGYTPPPQAALFFPFVSSLFGRVDQVNTVANFSRAPGVSTVEDFEGIIHNCLDGEARFWRARRVENLVGTFSHIDADSEFNSWDGSIFVGWGNPPPPNVIYSEELVDLPPGFNTGARITLNNNTENFFALAGAITVKEGEHYNISMWVKLEEWGTTTITEVFGNNVMTGAFQMSDLGLEPGDSHDWVKISYTTTAIADGNVNIRPSRDAVPGGNPTNGSMIVTGVQVEKITEPSDIPSEYVSARVIGAPWHGANVDGVQYFPTDREGNFLYDMRGCLVEIGDAGYDPGLGVQGTTQDETLNVSRPVVLLQAIVNNLTFACRSFLISDDPTPIQDATTLFIDSVNNDNNLRLVTASNSNYIFRKRTNNVGIDVVLANQGFESIARNLIASLTSDDGTHYSVNGETNQNENSDDVLALDTGDGLIHVGTNQTGNLHINAGISLLTVSG